MGFLSALKMVGGTGVSPVLAQAFACGYRTAGGGGSTSSWFWVFLKNMNGSFLRCGQDAALGLDRPHRTLVLILGVYGWPCRGKLTGWPGSGVSTEKQGERRVAAETPPKGPGSLA